MTHPFGWEFFIFFDKEELKDGGSVPGMTLESMQRPDIQCTSAGRGRLVFGDSEGFVTLVERDFSLVVFRAHKQSVSHVQQMIQHNLIFSIGNDEESGIEPKIKIWNLDKEDKGGGPQLARTIALKHVGLTTCMQVLEDLSQMVVGMADGSVTLIRGKLVRDLFTKQRLVVPPSRHPVTGLGLRQQNAGCVLFVATNQQVIRVVTTAKDTPVQVLDELGPDPNCSVMSDQKEFVVARSEAVYFYEPEGRGPCFAFENKKVMIKWLRQYMLVLTAEADATSGAMQFHTLTIYNMQNKFVAFSGRFPAISHIVAEWGSIFLITTNHRVIRLAEKDTQTKLQMLFKRAKYGLAINLAKSQQYDAVSIIDIHRKFGDHLYTKGDYNRAIERYVRTIGYLEPSYVIRKFLDAQRIHNLTTYLQALHEKGRANTDHTTLLLNCYTKLKDVAKLDEFIQTDSQLSFEVETAIKVCRQAGYHEHALYLAKSHQEHEWFLRILLENLKDYEQALEYISTLDFFEAERNLKKYGKQLVTAAPEQTTELLMQLCSNYVPRGQLASQQRAKVKAVPDEFVHIFVDQSDWLIRFLDFIVEHEEATPLVYNTLLELYLREDPTRADDPVYQQEQMERGMQLLLSPKAKFDMDHALVLCQLHDFKPGVLLLYERMGLFNEIVQYYMDNDAYDDVVEACKRYGDRDPNLWVQALTFLSGVEGDVHGAIMEVLHAVEEGNLLPPLRVVQILSTNATATLGMVKDYIIRKLQEENSRIEEDRREVRKAQQETAEMRREIAELKTKAKIFQHSKCSRCRAPLGLPAVHFLCMHSFHQSCLYDADPVCSICAPENQKIVDIRTSLQSQAGAHDTFFKQLRGAEDGFSTVAEYFGRGLFNEPEAQVAAASPHPAAAGGGGAPVARGPPVMDDFMLGEDVYMPGY